MKTDARIAKEGKALLASTIGKTLDSCQYGTFLRTDAAYGIVSLEIGKSLYRIANTLEYLDFWGEKEEVSVVSVHEGRPVDMDDKPVLIGWSAAPNHHKETFGRKIRDVLVYEDELIEFEDGKSLHSIVSTRAIVFDLEGTQLVLRMGDCFDETIFVERGPGAARKIPEVMAYVYEDERDHERAERTVTSLREWVADCGR